MRAAFVQCACRAHAVHTHAVHIEGRAEQRDSRGWHPEAAQESVAEGGVHDGEEEGLRGAREQLLAPLEHVSQGGADQLAHDERDNHSGRVWSVWSVWPRVVSRVSIADDERHDHSAAASRA